VEVDHLIDVHAIDVVGAEHRHQVRGEIFDQIQILIDGVGCSPIPDFTAAHLRGDHGDKLAAQEPTKAPPPGEVIDE
jgi:hypothetical protein